MQAKLSSNGVRASGVTVLSAVAAEKVSSSSCNNGAINGICIGIVYFFLLLYCLCSLHFMFCLIRAIFCLNCFCCVLCTDLYFYWTVLAALSDPVVCWRSMLHSRVCDLPVMSLKPSSAVSLHAIPLCLVLCCLPIFHNSWFFCTTSNLCRGQKLSTGNPRKSHTIPNITTLSRMMFPDDLETSSISHPACCLTI